MSHHLAAVEWLAPKVARLRVHAPHVVVNAEPGQFVIVRPTSQSERIPLTIADSDPLGGMITLIVQVVGATTRQLCQLEPGQPIADVAGPLGKPSHLNMSGHTVLVGGGVGTAVIYPQAKLLAESGAVVSAIIGGRSKPQVILEHELRTWCKDVYPCTDDGSYGFHGFVTDRLRLLIEQAELAVNQILCAGPVPMMRAVANLTRPLNIPTIASLNPIMVDGTGMCGGCRVSVDGKSRFACVDGPEFDAHRTDFDQLLARLTSYRQQERIAMEQELRRAS